MRRKRSLLAWASTIKPEDLDLLIHRREMGSGHLPAIEKQYILVEGMTVMRLENKEEYKNLHIIELNFSTRTYNCLMRAGLSTLYLLIENYDNLPEIRNMGAKSIAEIEEFLHDLEVNELNAAIFEKREAGNPVPDEESRPELPEVVLKRPATDLFVPIRVCNAFKREGIETIRQVVAMSASDMMKMRNMGALSVSQLQEQIELLYEKGEDYFQLSDEDVSLNADSSESADKAYDYGRLGKGFDFSVIDILTERFSFKASWMTEWFGLSRQSIYNVLEKRLSVRSGIWTGKKLTDSEHVILEGLIESRILSFLTPSSLLSKSLMYSADFSAQSCLPHSRTLSSATTMYAWAG